jgi:hypothetical protein
MKNKTVMISILSIFMLVTISFVSLSNAQTGETNEKKESPLYKIRTLDFINKEIQDVKSKFIEGRIFFAPLSRILLSLRAKSDILPSTGPHKNQVERSSYNNEATLAILCIKPTFDKTCPVQQ